MTKIVVDANTDGDKCGDCFHRRYDWLHCPLFEAVLEFDEEKKQRLRCPECLEAEKRAKDAGIA